MRSLEKEVVKRLRDGRARAGRRPSWCGPMRRLNRALLRSLRMIELSMTAARATYAQAAECPIRASRDLHRASGRLLGATIRLQRAGREIGSTAICAVSQAGVAAEVPPLLLEATLRWMATMQILNAAADQLFALHENVLDGLETGELVPEAEVPKRRVVIAPRIVYAREFLQCRRSTARDRIASVPIRRRRPRCRATADAPRRISRGRAPPSFSTCLL